MLLKTSVGIELAGSDLRIAIIRSAFRKMRLIRSLSIPGFAQLSAKDRKLSVMKLVQQYKIPSSRVFLSLPRELGIVRQIEFPMEVREKLKSAVELQLETLSPWPIEDVYWDLAASPAKSSAKSFNVSIAIIPRNALDPWIEFFKAVKLPLSGASLSSLACAHGSTSLWNERGPVIVLNCESEYVEGSLIQNDQIHSLTMKGPDAPIQAKAAIERLLALGRVPSAESARLIAYGSSAGSLESVEPIVLPIENAKTNNAERFGAISSAMTGLKKSAFASNLVPRELRFRRSRLQLIPAYALIGLTVLLGIALPARESYQFTVYSNTIAGEIEKVASEVQEVASQETELNALSEKYRALNTHFQNRDMNLEALRELARVLPASAWLGNYNYQDGSVSLSGFATTASEIQKALEDSPIFKDVQFTSSLMRESNGKDRFTLKATIERAR